MVGVAAVRRPDFATLAKSAACAPLTRGGAVGLTVVVDNFLIGALSVFVAAVADVTKGDTPADARDPDQHGRRRSRRDRARRCACRGCGRGRLDRPQRRGPAGRCARAGRQGRYRTALILAFAALAAAPVPAAPLRTLYASRFWVVFDRGPTCAALARSELLAAAGREQARATV